MWSRLSSGVRKLHDNLEPKFAFHQQKSSYYRKKKPKKHLSKWARCQKAIGGLKFAKMWRAETRQPGLMLDISNRGL